MFYHSVYVPAFSSLYPNDILWSFFVHSGSLIWYFLDLTVIHRDIFKTDCQEVDTNERLTFYSRICCRKASFQFLFYNNQRTHTTDTLNTYNNVAICSIESRSNHKSYLLPLWEFLHVDGTWPRINFKWSSLNIASSSYSQFLSDRRKFLYKAERVSS